VKTSIFKNKIISKITMEEIKNKNAGNGIALGTCFGLVFGASYGIISGNMSVGEGLGLAIGVFIGAIFDFVKHTKQNNAV
jgi:uncharacterized membrane protein